jgi:hypothetical protein
VITEKEILRAFVEPALYPFLLEEYSKNPLGKDRLDRDIALARAKYKEMVGHDRPATAPGSSPGGYVKKPFVKR